MNNNQKLLALGMALVVGCCGTSYVLGNMVATKISKNESKPKQTLAEKIDSIFPLSIPVKDQTVYDNGFTPTSELGSQQPTTAVPTATAPTQQPTTVALPKDSTYNIIISGNRLSCCTDCSYGLLIDKVNSMTGKSGIPTYLQINDDSNTIIAEYNGTAAAPIPLQESAIDDLLNLTDGYSKEIVTSTGDNFRNSVTSAGYTLEQFAYALGGNYLDALKTATQIDFVNAPSGNFTPQINIYKSDGSVIEQKIVDNNGKPDFGSYWVLQGMAGVPEY